jgi:hypothetical protein
VVFRSAPADRSRTMRCRGGVRTWSPL